MPTIIEELETLKKQIKELEADHDEMHRNLIEAHEENHQLQRQIDRNERAEEELYRDRDRLKSTLRRRGQMQMEKATLKTRTEAVRALAGLLPQAKKQAKEGKPALLRLILRASR